MHHTDFAIALLLAVTGGCAALLALWIYYDRRDRLLYDRTRCRVTFHCLKCSHVYSGVERTSPSPCPRCGHPNSRLRF